MGLFNCVKCGHLVSTSAVKCPKCGIEEPCDIERWNEKLNLEKREKDECIERKKKLEEREIEWKKKCERLENFGKTLISCPECNEKKPLKFYLHLYDKKEKLYNGQQSPCPNCGFPVRMNCDVCKEQKMDIVYTEANDTEAIVYNDLGNRVYKLCCFHSPFESEDQIREYILKKIPENCKRCGRRLSFWEIIKGEKRCGSHAWELTLWKRIKRKLFGGSWKSSDFGNEYFDTD